MAVTMMRKVLFSLMIFFVFGTILCNVTKRKVTIIPWPDCNNDECQHAKNNGLNVVYAKATAPGDSLLYAFSTIGMPTIVLARVPGSETDMHFNWTKLINETSFEDAITINGTAEYKFGVAFTRLIEYNDADDSADLEYADKKYNNTYWNIKDFSNFKWEIGQDKLNDNIFVFNATSFTNNNSSGNWSISFSFNVKQDEGRSSQLPSLKYEANETLLDFVIANYTPTFSKSRFALEALLVSESTSDMKVETLDSIDDEYSPGVFEILNWLSNPSEKETSGYLQWKPVCYNSQDRSRSSATKVKHYDLSDLKNHENLTIFLNSSIIYALLGEQLYNENAFVIRLTNISFGLSEDEFYLKNNYTAWTAAFGYGSPPVDSISLMVIVIISVGLGLPVIIIIFGGLYTCVTRSRRRAQYQPINEPNVSITQPLVN